METVPPNPFKGLRPYKQEDQDKLFGRNRDLILMKDRVFSARTTLLFAASGVGKTSFLNAKVIPELKKQCAVVWHNRWTGADELEPAGDEFAEDRGFRFWPPRAMFRDLIGKFRRKSDEEFASRPPAVRAEPNEERLTTEVHRVIAQSLRQSSDDAQPRLSQVLAGFRRSSKDPARTYNPQDDRCILVLDQFEEVFQYHAYEDYFGKFVKDLCEIINNDDYQVRVVFSMREEFLGELSVFDNKIPDLFINYYRLRYPDKDEAEDIIRRTCQLSGVDPHEDKLLALVEDLSKIEKGGGSIAERSKGHGKARTQVIKRNFVAPPYLQIACERLWNQQYAQNEKPAGPLLTEPVALSDKGPSYPPFLINYNVGNGKSADEEPGGDAQKALRSFCEEKLSAPFLSRSEQNTVARAFGFLVTKQGAKMAYELRSLAEHMDTRVWPLKTALEKLSQDDAKILRESRGPDRSYWFELYHDMYASIVDEWKIRYLKLWKKRTILKWITSVVAVAGVTAGTLLLIFAVATWVIIPSMAKTRLLEFKGRIKDSKIEQLNDYTETVAAYTNLKNTWGYEKTAASLWADILERRAQWFEIENDPSSALLCLLKAAEMEPDPQKRQQHLVDAEILLGAPNGSLLATYCDDCAAASLSPDGKRVVTLSRDGTVTLWRAESGERLGSRSLCDDCTQAIFSADGTAVLTETTVTGQDARDDQSDDPLRRPGGTPPVSPRPRNRSGSRVQVWDAITQNQLTNSIELKPDTRVATTSSRSDPAGRVVDSTTEMPDRQVRAFGRIGQAFWFVGLSGDQLYAWDMSGRALALKDEPGSIAFSPDSQYLLARFFRQQMMWKVTETEIKPYPLTQLNTSVAAILSPNGRFLLSADKDKTVQLIDLKSRNTLVSLPPFPNVLSSLGFSPSGNQFFTRLREEESDVIQIWKTDSGEPLFGPLRLRGGAYRRALGPEGSTFLRASRGVIEKWDTQSERLLGVIKRESQYPTFSADGNSVLIPDRTARLWFIDSNMEGRRFIQGDIKQAGISLDGKTLLTADSSSNLQFWDAEQGLPSGQPITLGEELSMANLSDDGKYAAAAHQKTISVWQAGGTGAIATLAYDGNAALIGFSSDNKTLAAVDDSTINLWNLESGKEITPGEQHSGAVIDVAFAGDKMISGSDDQTAKIWNVHTGQRVQNLNHNGEVTAVAISADGRLALTGGADGRLRLWDIEKGTAVGGEIKYEGQINDLKFSSDGRFAIALTRAWMYVCSVDENGLHYSKGTLIADSLEPLLSILDNGKRFRFAYSLNRMGIEILDLQSEPTESLKVFKGEPTVLLDEWQRKLGLSIGELGKIEKMWQTATVKDDAQQTK